MNADLRETIAELRNLKRVSGFYDYQFLDRLAAALPALLDAAERGIDSTDQAAELEMKVRIRDAEIKRLRDRRGIIPDFIYDHRDLEWGGSYEWTDRDLLADEYAANGALWEPVKFCTLINGPSVWAKKVVVTKDENGDPDETEVQWFWSREEAEKARVEE